MTEVVMTRKGHLLVWADVLNGLLMLGLIITGSIMKWVLPPGSGGGGGEHIGRSFRGGRGEHAAETLWSMTRHEWGDLHFWIAAALVAFILLHLALHFGWIAAASRRYLRWLRFGQRRAAATACLLP
jgi:hypothetical protein